MSDSRDNKPLSAMAGFVGLISSALVVVGVGSAIAAVASLAQSEPIFVGCGLCLIASALSFGLLLNGCVRG